MSNYELHRFSSAEALAREVAERWVAEVRSAQQQSHPHRVALSGGRIARKFFQATVLAACEEGVRFNAVDFFWADERCVPPDHPESNYGIAYRLLLEPLGVVAAQVHRLKGEAPEATAAADASAELLGIAPANQSGVPVLDLVLLGMGEDGHVASLFPNETKAASESADIYRSVVATKPPPCRLTLGYQVMAAAQSVWVLISGAGKESALRESLKTDGNTPLSRVLRQRSNTLIFSDLSGI